MYLRGGAAGLFLFSVRLLGWIAIPIALVIVLVVFIYELKKAMKSIK